MKLKSQALRASLVGALVSVALLSGCASVQMADKEKDVAAKTFAAPASNKSGIYIYRNSFVGQALKKDVLLNGERLGETANKTYFYRQVNPGKQRVSTESEFSNNDLEFTTEPGKNYFVRQYIKMGVFVGGAGLELVDEAKGRAEVAQCGLAQ